MILNNSLKRFALFVSLPLILAGNSFAEENGAGNTDQNGLVPKHFDVTPTPEVMDAVRDAMGGMSPDMTAQTEKAIESYEHAKQYQLEAKSITDTFQVKLHQPTPITLKVINGYETELLFFDLKGQPWPVGDVSSGNKKLVQAVVSEVMPHSVAISTVDGRFAGRTNLKVRFEGLEASIGFPILVNTQVYHDTLKVVLPGINPLAEKTDQVFDMRNALDDPIARAILDNPIEPDTNSKCDSRLVIARSISGQTLLGTQPAAFLCDESLYIRTRYLAAPAPEPNGVVHGPDGFRVYRFLYAGEIFTFRSRDGRPIFLEVAKPNNQIGARFDDSARLQK